MGNTKRTAGGAKGLESDYYLSEAVFKRETERIFRQSWLCLGRRDAMARPGSYRLHHIAGEQLLIACDASEQISAHYNVCRHRGTRLCEDVQTRVSKTIQCPYHGWTYDLGGRLIGAPNMPDDFDREPHSLRSVAVDGWEGFLFVNLADEPDPLDAFLAPVWKRFSASQLSRLRVVHEISYDVSANWKLLFQNYSECYHCPTLHPQLNRLTHYRDSSNDYDTGAILGGPMKLSGNAMSMTSSGERCAPLLDKANRDKLVYYFTVFPSLFLSIFPDYALVHLLERRSTNRTRVTCQWLFSPDAITLPDFDPGPAIEFWDLTNRQDWHICELAQEGVASAGYSPGPYSDLESLLAAFDRAYHAALGV